MTTATTAEAMALLHEHRGDHIAAARKVADELITRFGSADASQVREEMALRGLIPVGVPYHWLGAVFRGGRYVWNGEWATGHFGPSTHNSARPIKRWRFA